MKDILLKYSFNDLRYGCKNLLNYTFITIEFHNRDWATTPFVNKDLGIIRDYHDTSALQIHTIVLQIVFLQMKAVTSRLHPSMLIFASGIFCTNIKSFFEFFTFKNRKFQFYITETPDLHLFLKFWLLHTKGVSKFYCYNICSVTLHVSIYI